METGTLYVAFSHKLTEEQTKGWEKVVSLSETNPELQAKMSNIPASATLEEIQSLAAAIVKEAIAAGATHFYCSGEPTLMLWANLYASQALSMDIHAEEQVSIVVGARKGFSWRTKMICVQSTTERKSVEVTQDDGTVLKTSVFRHVQWREIF